VAVRITTSFDSLDGWDQIKQLDEEYSVWAGKDTSDLPGSTFADAVDQVSDWLQGRHTLDVKLEDLIGLEIDIEEVGQPRKTVRDEGQLRDASSNGLSYLILCVVFVGLINKIRAGQPVQLVWALDELRDLDLDNVRVLLNMLADNQIHLVSAFPDPEPEILACRRAFKTDQLCALNFDQGLKPPVIGMAVDKCNVFAKFGTSSGLVGIL
jgi:hypothetical protein